MNFNYPEWFEYAFDTDLNTRGIYLIELSQDKQSVEELNIHPDLKDSNDVYSVPSVGENFYLYDNNEKDINDLNKGKMRELYVKITVNNTNVIFKMAEKLNELEG